MTATTRVNRIRAAQKEIGKACMGLNAHLSWEAIEPALGIASRCKDKATHNGMNAHDLARKAGYVPGHTSRKYRVKDAPEGRYVTETVVTFVPAARYLPLDREAMLVAKARARKAVKMLDAIGFTPAEIEQSLHLAKGSAPRYLRRPRSLYARAA